MVRLWALVVLVLLVLGLGGEMDACGNNNRLAGMQGACAAKASCTLAEPTTAALLQSSSLLKSTSEPAESALLDDGFVPPEAALLDDGSQVSAQGPPLTLSEALRLLGSTRSQQLGRQPHRLLAHYHWRGQKPREFSVARGLNRVAVVYISGRPDFNKALEEAVLRYAPMGSIFHTPGKIPGNFVAALEHAVAAFPSALWYYVADDDSFVHLERLADLAQGYNASGRHFIGHHDCAGTTCGPQLVKCRRQHMEGEASPGWACGGPGVLISRPLAQEMAAQRCSTFYSVDPAPVCCGDMVLACCAYDVWEGLQVSNAPGFTPDNTTGLQMTGLVAIHHITPAVTRALGKAYNSHLRAKR